MQKKLIIAILHRSLNNCFKRFAVKTKSKNNIRRCCLCVVWTAVLHKIQEQDERFPSTVLKIWIPKHKKKKKITKFSNKNFWTKISEQKFPNKNFRTKIFRTQISEQKLSEQKFSEQKFSNKNCSFLYY